MRRIPGSGGARIGAWLKDAQGYIACSQDNLKYRPKAREGVLAAKDIFSEVGVQKCLGILSFVRRVGRSFIRHELGQASRACRS